MNLEDRLRAELERSSRSTRVGIAPSVDELASVATSRRARNRLVGSAGAVALSGTLLIAAFVASQPDDDTVVVADGGSDSALVDDDAFSAAPNEEVGEESAAVAPDEADDDNVERATPTTVAEKPVGPLGDDDVEAAPDAISDVDPGIVSGTSPLQNALQGPEGRLDVSVRESAVEFAGGSGVLIVADDAGYRGLASKFGDAGATLVGLSSTNGLDWVETQLVGVPSGATASILRSFDGGHVALFSRFDVDAGQNRTFVGTSSDLVTWDMSDPLPGQGIATDLAVGPSGVMVIGDDFEPNIWFGPLGGPLELTARLDAGMLYGVTTLGNEFLVAGRSDLGATLFTSQDGQSWGARQLTSPLVEAASQSVSVADGTIVLTTVGDNGVVTLVSDDGGESWERLGDGEVRSISVSGSALGFLGGEGADSTVTLSDGESFASAALDLPAPDRVSLLTTTTDQAVMLVQTEDGTLTWVVASR